MESIPTFAPNPSYKTLSTFSIGPDGLNTDLDKIDFKTTRPFRRIEEYRNLLRSVKKYFNRKIRTYTPEEEVLFSVKLNALTELLVPYVYWELWTNSEYCSFSQEEIAVIGIIRKTNSIELASKKLRFEPEKLNELFTKVIRKLKFAETLSDYNWWFKAQHQLTSRKELFLNAPLNTLKNRISTRILSALGDLGNTLNEVLSKTSERELLMSKRLSEKGLIELKTLLEKFDCLERLKEV